MLKVQENVEGADCNPAAPHQHWKSRWGAPRQQGSFPSQNASPKLDLPSYLGISSNLLLLGSLLWKHCLIFISMPITTDTNSTITLYDRENSQLSHELCIFASDECQPACRAHKTAPAQKTHCHHCWNVQESMNVMGAFFSAWRYSVPYLSFMCTSMSDVHPPLTWNNRTG